MCLCVCLTTCKQNTATYNFLRFYDKFCQFFVFNMLRNISIKYRIVRIVTDFFIALRIHVKMVSLRKRTCRSNPWNVNEFVSNASYHKLVVTLEL